MPDRTTAWALWAMARPSQVLLICWVYLLGVGIAATQGAAIDIGGVAVGLLAIVPTAASVHYANEYADVDTDRKTDRTPFSGGSGALPATGLPRSLARDATIGAGAVGLVVTATAALAGVLPPTAVVLLATIAVLGWAYSVGPALSRRGLGELDNAVLGGLLLPLYGAAVVRGASLGVAAAVVPFFLLVFPNLFATQWADRRADAAVGKRTLAVRWSDRRLRAAHAGALVAYVVAVLALWGRGFPHAVAVGSIAVAPLGVWATIRFTRQQSPFPSVVTMVACAVVQGIAWWALAL